MNKELCEIAISKLKIKNMNSIKNSSLKLEQIESLMNELLLNWNDVVYAFRKIEKFEEKNEENYDPRFYFKSIIFNLFMINSIGRRLGSSKFAENSSLKDLRDNLAHLDEKLKKPLKLVSPDELKAPPEDPQIIVNGYPMHGNINGVKTTGKTIASVFGVYSDVIFSTLEPSNKSSDNYKRKKFAKFEINKKILLATQTVITDEATKYYQKIEYRSKIPIL